MNRGRWGFYISHVYTLWQDLSHHTIIFYPSDIHILLTMICIFGPELWLTLHYFALHPMEKIFKTSF